MITIKINARIIAPIMTFRSRFSGFSVALDTISTTVAYQKTMRKPPPRRYLRHSDVWAPIAMFFATLASVVILAILRVPIPPGLQVVLYLSLAGDLGFLGRGLRQVDTRHEELEARMLAAQRLARELGCSETSAAHILGTDVRRALTAAQGDRER